MLLTSRLVPGLITGLLLIAAPLFVAAAELPCAPPPADDAPSFGQEPVVEQSATRGEVVLNGLWRFMPAVDAAQLAPMGTWGWLRVPGSWRESMGAIEITNLVTPGDGSPGWRNRDALTRGWYERPLRIPAAWTDRSIQLELTRVSTDAQVLIDGRTAGTLTWPGGLLDLTALVTPGREHQLRVLVAASASDGQVLLSMGTGANQQTAGAMALQSCGLTGDVVLHSQPRRGRVDDVFVIPSVRRSELALEITLGQVDLAGQAQFTIDLLDDHGTVERSFAASAPLAVLDRQTVRLSFPWRDARRWELDDGQCYTAAVRVRAPGITDDYRQAFGFREFWVEGREFRLNGTPFRWRPQLATESWCQIGGEDAHLEGVMRGARQTGYNILELWPERLEARGAVEWSQSWYRVADRLGFPLIGRSPHVADLIFAANGALRWTDANRAAFQQTCERELRRARNHPSILAYASTGNYFGHVQDQNPRVLGRRAWVPRDQATWWAAAAAGHEALAMVRGIDPTRPVFYHQGADVGDVFGVNTYLNWHPLQEREEWLSAWATAGEMPYMAVEFGTPLHCSFNRGRKDGGWDKSHGGASASEPLLSEYAAAYLGREAYALEESAYRAALAERFIGGDDGQHWQSWQGDARLNLAAANQRIQALFSTSTWRSWRTWGISGGMVPWDEGYAYAYRDVGTSPHPWVPGTRGMWRPRLLNRYAFDATEAGGAALTPAGAALRACNHDTLAWIAGPAAAFTDKAHHWVGGRRLEKQAILINDLRRVVQARGEWTVQVGSTVIGQGTIDAPVPIGSDLRLPITAELPTVDQITEGAVTLRVDLGGMVHADRFPFRLHPRLAAVAGELLIHDPMGDTAELLRGLGATLRPWDGKPSAQPLIIGRRALSDGSELPGGLPGLLAHAEAGGTVIVMGQDPEWLHRAWGLRVARLVSRRAWPVGDHPLTQGLDGEDLRDWNGHGTLLTERVAGDLEQEPPYGWRWGTRGSVASAMIEKPQRSGWTPLIEGEFDLGYSPLLERRAGAGRLILCQLDLEGRRDDAATGGDPVAQLIASRLITYARTQPTVPAPATALLFGDAADAARLDAVGVRYRLATTADPTPGAGPLIIGRQVMDDDRLRQAIAAGATAVVLSRDSATGPFGIRYAERRACGSLTAPDWAWCAGLSASDLRWRAEASRWLIADGADQAADGQLGQIALGRGRILVAQLDPDAFAADRLTYFRLTRWRQTRALAQVLANAGAAFTTDSALGSDGALNPALPIAGAWRISTTAALPSAPDYGSGAHSDPGISPRAREVIAHPPADAATCTMPGPLPGFASQDGEAVVWTTVIVPPAWQGQELILHLGAIDDFDDTFINGELIGQTTKDTPDFWIAQRHYRIPARLVRSGANQIAVRIWDHFGGAGMIGLPDNLRLERVAPTPPGLYHPDWRTDFNLGDEPSRYKRW